VPPKRKPKKKRKAPAQLPPEPRNTGGRPATDVNLEEVTRLRALGLRSISKIARAMNIPKSTLTGDKHGAAVKEAFEIGAVEAEVIALEQYERGINTDGGSPVPFALLIFKMKQFGWTDRQVVETRDELGPATRERIREAIEKLRSKRGKARA